MTCENRAHGAAGEVMAFRHLVVRVSLWSLVVLPGAVAAQGVLDPLRGSIADDAFGFAVAPAGDLDGDSVGDLWVGIPQFQFSGAHSGTGRVEAYSGATGALLYSVQGAVRGDNFGSIVANLGDLDGDRVADFAVGVPRETLGTGATGALHLFSAASRQLLIALPAPTGHRFSAVVSTGDLDRDAVPDLVVGVSGLASGNGLVQALSGASLTTGSVRVIWSRHGTAGEFLGEAIARSADLDGDGIDDVVVGAPEGGSNFGGRVLALSGVDGHELMTYGSIESRTGFEEFGCSVASVRSLDRDALPELIVGARYAANFHGTVVVWSSANQARMFELTGTANGSEFGSAVCGLDDWDGDGWDDFAVGVPHGSVGGEARIYSGANFQLIGMQVGAMGDDLGYSVTNLGELYRDGRGCLAIGNPGFFNGGRQGEVRILHGPRTGANAAPFLDATPAMIAVGTGGTQNLTLLAGPLHGGRPYFMLSTLSGSDPGAFYSGSWIPLNPDPWTSLVISNANAWPFLGFFGVLDAQGGAQAAFVVPPGVPSGLRLHHVYLAFAGQELRVVSNIAPLDLR